MIRNFDFHKTKYGAELLIDLIRLETLENYILTDNPHTLSYYDITLTSNGEGNFRLDDYSFPISQYQLIFSSPGQVRKWEIEKAPTGLVLIFEEEFLCTFFNDAEFVQKLTYFHTINSSPNLLLNDDDHQYLCNIMRNIEYEILSYRAQDKHVLRALLYQVLVWLDRAYKNRNQITEERLTNRYIANFRKNVENNFHNQHSVIVYAEELNITPGHLNLLSNEFLGLSAKKYIQKRVILEAKRLLTYSQLSVAEIAWNLSYEDESYFTRFFKSKTGLTPNAYRNNTNI